jgi:hypothetical protein
MQSIFLFNVQGLSPAKTAIIKQFLILRRPLALILTETHLVGDALEIQFFPSEFICYTFPGLSVHSGGLMIIVNSSLAGSTLLSAPSPRSFPAPNSSLWGAVHIRLPFSQRDIFLLAAYLQPADESYSQTVNFLLQDVDDLLNTVSAFSSSPASGPGPQNSSRSPSILHPHVILCGDFNCHHPSLSTNPSNSRSAASDILLSELDLLGFCCANAEYAFGTPTHKREGVLDLFLYYNPTSSRSSTPPTITALNVDNNATTELGACPSDHFPVEAMLSLDSVQHHFPSPNTLPLQRLRRWDVERASKEGINSFTSTIQSQLQNGNIENDRVYDYTTSLSSLSTFVCTSSNPDRYLPAAQSAIDRTVNTLTAIITAAADSHFPRKEQCSSNNHEWTREIRKAYNRAKKARKEALRSSNASDSWQKEKTATEAFAEFSSLQRQHSQQRYRDLCTAIEEANVKGRRELSWPAFNKIHHLRNRAAYLRPGLQDASGRPSATMEEAIHQMSEYFRQQFTEHPPLSETQRTSSANESGDVEEKIIDERSIGRSAVLSELALTPPPRHSQFLHILQSNHPRCPFSVDSVRELFSRASTKTTPGPDGINGQLLRWAAQAPAFIEHLHMIFNFCYMYHVLPQSWRQANLLPLHKLGTNPSLCTSFRPISITSLFIRLFEYLIKDRIHTQIDAVLSRWQYGFRSMRHTRLHILYLQEKILRALRCRGNQAYPVIFLDISRAFDSVPHDAVLTKLLMAGIRGDDLHFFAAYLSGRQFRILASGQVGEWKHVAAGVPQGSVLAPLLYALFINDLFPDLRSMEISTAFSTDPGQLLFADDIALAPPSLLTPVNSSSDPAASSANLHPLSLSQLCETMQSRLDSLGKWASLWGVRFSATKSGCVWFRFNHLRLSFRSPLTFNIHYSLTQSLSIPNVSNYKYLGVFLDECFSPHPHITHVLKKARFYSNLLSSLCTRTNRPGYQILRRLTDATFLPAILYGLSFVVPTKKDFDRLNSLYHRPIQRLMHLPLSVHRAGFAHFFDMPIIQIQRDRSFLQLFASVFALRFRPGLSTSVLLSEFPVYNLLAAECSSRSFSAKADRLPSTISSSQPPSQQFLTLCQLWSLGSSLPSDNALCSFNPTATESPAPSISRAPADTSAALLSSKIDSAAHFQSVRHWVKEWQGLPSYSSTRNPKKNSQRPAKGLFLPQFYGLSTSDFRSSYSIAADIVENWSHPVRCYPALLQLETDKAQTLSRLVLNRSSLKAVRLARAKPPAPIAETLCRNCQLNEPETVLHTAVHCPLLKQHRTEFFEKLERDDSLNFELSKLRSHRTSLYPLSPNASPRRPPSSTPPPSPSSSDTFQLHLLLCATHIISSLSPPQLALYYKIVSVFLHYLQLLRDP